MLQADLALKERDSRPVRTFCYRPILEGPDRGVVNERYHDSSHSGPLSDDGFVLGSPPYERPLSAPSAAIAKSRRRHLPQDGPGRIGPSGEPYSDGGGAVQEP